VDGAGLAVVVVDSGLNQHHISFQGKIIPGKNFSTAGGPDDTTDNDSHGSNVAGIIMGNELPPNSKMPTGVAPQAKVVPLKVFPGGQFSKINDALQWIKDNRDQIAKPPHNALISVVNLSLGTSENLSSINEAGQGQARKRQWQLIRDLRNMNIVVTVSAGNDYFQFQSQQGMCFPAICPETTSVGALFDTDIPTGVEGLPFHFVSGAIVNSAHRGKCVAFSQRLSDAAGSTFRTDVFAPGFIMTSAGGIPPQGQDPSTSRSTQNGTSQAAPITAGLALLLQQHYRNLTAEDANPARLPSVDLVEQCLREGGVAFTDDEDAVAQAMDNVTGCGAEFVRVDAVQALRFLSNHLQQEPQTDLRALQVELMQAEPDEQGEVLRKAAALQK
jgi:subtilisin family serine protease